VQLPHGARSRPGINRRSIELPDGTQVARDANNSTVPGILRAFKASDVSQELWNSEQNSARDSYGLFAKFNPPTVWNGKVYLATFSKQFCVYGPLK
jgi:hypothetical protein